MSDLDTEAREFVERMKALPQAKFSAIIRVIARDEELVEDIVDVAIAEKRRGEPMQPFREFMDELRREGTQGSREDDPEQ